MITVLAKIFIKEEGKEPAQIRQAYGMLCGIVGILLNLLLFAGKFVAGTISHSIAITADAFNNLSDAASSGITLVGFKMANTKPDPSHPFGHGRIEYLSGLIVSGIILIMGFELVRDSITKIIHPEETQFSLIAIAILVISILVKLYMSVYNRSIGKRIDSGALRATATDSLSDTCATAVVLIATLVGHFTGLHIDGWCGVLVGVFILYAGISSARDTLNPLLGQPPEPEFVASIEQIVMAHEEIIGIHDLIVHDYGPGRVMVSLHAEVPAEEEVLELHDTIDVIEHELQTKLYCAAVIHMDPVVTTDEALKECKQQVAHIIKEIDETITMHDFRMVPGKTHTNLIFDVVVPFKYSTSDEDLVEKIAAQVKAQIGSTYFCVIQVDKAYV